MAAAIFAVSACASDELGGVKLAQLVRAAEVPIEGLFAVVEHMLHDDESAAQAVLSSLRAAYDRCSRLFPKFQKLWEEAGGADDEKCHLAWYLFLVAKKRLLGADAADLARSFELLVAVVKFVRGRPDAPEAQQMQTKRRRLSLEGAHAGGADESEVAALVESVSSLVADLEKENVFGRYGPNDVVGRAKKLAAHYGATITSIAALDERFPINVGKAAAHTPSRGKRVAADSAKTTPSGARTLFGGEAADAAPSAAAGASMLPSSPIGRSRPPIGSSRGRRTFMTPSSSSSASRDRPNLSCPWSPGPHATPVSAALEAQRWLRAQLER